MRGLGESGGIFCACVVLAFALCAAEEEREYFRSICTAHHHRWTAK